MLLVMLLAGGGLLYSLGVVVHLAARLPNHNALWHTLVVAAATCHYLVILHLAQTAG
jgi:hemolysin III